MAHPRKQSLSPSRFGSRTDVGCVREHNEDSLIVIPPLFAVCDGMGGHAAGEVASDIATQVLAKLAPQTLDARALSKAVEAANEAIITAASEGRGREGMGTTCTAAMIEGERMLVAQVGDSRAYLLHNGKLQQITRDHSLVADMVEAGQITAEEARVHPSRSIITRALGTSPNTRPDIYELNVAAGDRLLLCSDGLSGMIEDAQIEEIMARFSEPQHCASVLVNEAIAAGGLDNVTVIVVDIEGAAPRNRRKIAIKTKLMAAFIILLLIGVFAGTGYWVTWKANNSYFVGTDDTGHIAVYRGTVEPWLWTNVHEQVFGNTSNLTLAEMEKVPALTTPVNDIKSGGKPCDSIEAAYNLINEWSNEVKSTQQTPSPGTNTESTSDKQVETEQKNESVPAPSDKDEASTSAQQNDEVVSE